ncbi:hypothetical protein WN51_11788 [Melipona quadrifasciata]|uniref:Uncharacterized protein n=1 Tax=Melipona quadrifasciata TaxID=166423 RepID=A0A0N0U612_9HYME|nr:hypothetical protein WN51_11788 [Melipona quadrifasciata]
MSLVTLGVTPGFALTIPGYQHRPPCAQGSITPFLTILPARHTVADYSYSPRTRIVRGSPYVLSRVAEVMAGYVAAELFLALLRLEPTGPLRSPKALPVSQASIQVPRIQSELVFQNKDFCVEVLDKFNSLGIVEAALPQYTIEIFERITASRITIRKLPELTSPSRSYAGCQIC